MKKAATKLLGVSSFRPCAARCTHAQTPSARWDRGDVGRPKGAAAEQLSGMRRAGSIGRHACLLCWPLPVTLVAWCARHADAPPTAVVPSLRAFLRLSFSLSLQFVNRKGAAMGRPGPGA